MYPPEEGLRPVEAEKKCGYDFLKLHPGLTRKRFGATRGIAGEILNGRWMDRAFIEKSLKQMKKN